MWVDGAFIFETGRTSRKGRNLERDPRCTLSLALHDFDLVVEGEAEIVTDPAVVAEVARALRRGGWPARVDESGTALTAEFSAPSAGPPPWHVYRVVPKTAMVLSTVEPGGRDGLASGTTSPHPRLSGSSGGREPIASCGEVLDREGRVLRLRGRTRPPTSSAARRRRCGSYALVSDGVQPVCRAQGSADRDHHVDDWVLQVAVPVDVGRGRGERSFERAVRRYRLGVSSHPVPKQERQSLVRRSDETYVKVHVSRELTPATPEPLRPHRRIVRSSRGHVILLVGQALEPHRRQRVIEMSAAMSRSATLTCMSRRSLAAIIGIAVLPMCSMRSASVPDARRVVRRGAKTRSGHRES